jgi:dihydroxy-acid dehydratase
MRAPTGGHQFDGDGLEALILRMFMRGAGRPADAFRRGPVIGICNSWSELNPCNLGLRRLAAGVQRGVAEAGGVALEFPTISLGEPYLKPSSLLLRNLMAMDVEQMIEMSPIDAVVLLNGCDKTVPAQLMGALSAGKPALSLAAGPRPVVRHGEQVLTIDELWRAGELRRRGELDDAGWLEVEETLNCDVGTCNVMGTAATMAIASEALGLSLPGTALLPAASDARAEAAEATGRRAVELAASGTSPAEFVTLESLENAFRAVCAVGGSTNAVIHLEALAGRLGERLGLDRLARWSDETPVLADVRPSGSFLLEDLDAAGGVPALLAELAPLLHLDALAGTGETWTDVLARARRRPSDALQPLADPKEPRGGIAVLRGSLAPQGAVLKRSGTLLRRQRGRAVVFDGVDDLLARVDDPALPPEAEAVLVLRNVGPLGGPGMPEVFEFPIPERLRAAGATDVLRITDGRMSGTAAGAVVLHVTPEAAAGGPLAFVRDGDVIELDVDEGRLDLCVPEAELEERRRTFTAPRPPVRGYERLHHLHVLPANEGCDLDFLAVARVGDRV